jgi:DNA ligase D-like protein (predicted ligase)
MPHVLPAARSALAFVPPLIPTLVEKPPAGSGWIHEIKHDGYRVQIIVDRGRARGFTRNGLDWTKRFGPVIDCAASLRCTSAVIDGELVVQNESGLSDFHAVRAAIGARAEKLALFAFDLLHLDGEDLRLRPIGERRAALRKTLGEDDPTRCIQFSDGHEGDGAALFAAADQMGLEGIVSKRAGSLYKSGRSSAWLKTKCMTESEFVVVGMEANPGGAPYALLAREEEGGLVYAGSAFVTLGAADRDRFWTMTETLHVPKAVVAELREGKRKATFVRPELRVRARHLKGGGMLRHASLTALL